MTINETPTLRRGVRNYKDRNVTFYDLAARDTPGAVLDHATETGADVVMLCTDRLATLGELREWVHGEYLGWRMESSYLRAPNPVLRFEGTGGSVEIHRAAEWFGEGAYSAFDAHTAWRVLGAEISSAFDHGQVLATPGTTGRYLLLRSIPYDREWPCLPDDLQELVRATSGQGRIEVLRRGAATTDVVELDGRFMYAALVRELGAGVPVLDEVDEYAGHQRGRYQVVAQVPKDWHQRCACGAPGHAGIGILPYAGDERWEWPHEPGRAFGTWCDAVELGIALAHGWSVSIDHRLLFPMPPYPVIVDRRNRKNARGPLDAWADTLVELRGRCSPVGTDWEPSGLVATALRNIVLHTIGSLHGAGHRIQHRADIYAAGDAIPADAIDVERIGDDLVWFEMGGAAWPEMSHPEWSAAIWARARARLLSGPGNTGALHVPADDVLAFRTDAIYLRTDPEWTDDGKPGRFRRVASWAGVPTPRTLGELDTIKAGR